VEIAEHIICLRSEGELLARAAESVPLDTPVPSCPGWRARDLLAHLGFVHRWATGYVAGG
jgi:Mycothiol maleylpyruvate isomerase N-terminal domain